MNMTEQAKALIKKQKHLFDLIGELRKRVHAIGHQIGPLEFQLEIGDTFFLLIQHEDIYLLEVINKDMQFEFIYNKEWIVPAADVAKEIEKKIDELKKQ